MNAVADMAEHDRRLQDKESLIAAFVMLDALI